MHRILASLAVLGLVSGLSCQNTIHVNGPDLQTAIDAAAPGDVLLVSGSFFGMTLRVPKPLYIHGSPGATIVSVHEPMTIERVLRPGVLQGFRIVGGLSIRDCPGSILIAGVSTTSRAITVSRCSQVSFDDCQADYGLVVDSSIVSLTNSSWHGATSGRTSQLGATPGLLARLRSTVVAAHCTFVGGSQPVAGAPPARAGIELANSDLRLSGADSVVTAGREAGRDVDAIGGFGQLTIDPRIVLTPSGNGAAIAPAIQVTHAQRPTTGIVRAPLGGVATIDVRGNARDAFFLLGGAPGVRTVFANIDGELWVADPAIVASGLLDASGRFSLSFVVPPAPILRAFQFRWQAITSDGVTVAWAEPVTECHR